MTEKIIIQGSEDWKVFPCHFKSKTPKTKHGFKDATNDQKIIDSWKAQGKCNWGLSLGDSDLSVIDIDVRNGGNFREEPDTFVISSQDEEWKVPKTLLVKTGGGGYHLYYKGARSLPKQLADGIDFKSKGGYVIMPPSTHPSGNKYEWANSLPITDFPEYILPKETEYKPSNNTQVEYSEVSKALFGLSHSRADNYHEWSKVGMILHTLGNEYLQLWDAWSRQSSKYEIGECDKKWETFNSSGGLTVATLFKWAKDDNLPNKKNNDPSAKESLSGNENLIDNPIIPQDEEENLELTQKFNLTDLGNAQRFEEMHKDKARYCAEDRKWYVWNGKFWEKDKYQKVYLLAEDVIKLLHLEAAKTTDKQEREAIGKHAIKSESSYSIQQMVRLAESHLPISLSDFDTDIGLVNVNNGIIELKTGKLLPHNPDYFMSKFISYDYDPNAECPKWLDYLNFAQQGDQETIKWIQKALGLSISGETAKILPFLYGENADNGKSGFAETLLALFGTYGQKTSVEAMSLGDFRSGGDKPNSVVARMRGARFIISNEMEEGLKLNVAMIKDLTGGDTITAREMRQNAEQFTPTHTLWLYGNHKPKIADDNGAIWNRVCEIPFVVSIPKEKQLPIMQDVIDMFLTEAPGILNWIVKGYALMRKEGLAKTESIKKATNQFRDEEDIFKQFIEEKFEFGENYTVPKDTLISMFSDYCKEYGNKESKLSKSKITRRLTKEHNVVAYGRGASLFKGLKPTQNTMLFDDSGY